RGDICVAIHDLLPVRPAVHSRRCSNSRSILIKLVNMKTTADRTAAPYLSAREAAAELGVSLPTLYAYVSRGLVRSEPMAGERARRYRAEDVRALRERRAPPADGGPASRAASAFSYGQPVLSSAITLIADGELYYRGVRAAELARHATLETAAGILWQTADYDPFEPHNLPAGSAALRA